MKKTPSEECIRYVNEVCKILASRKLTADNDVMQSLWILNCIVYSSIAAWIVIKKIKGMEVKRVSGSGNKKVSRDIQSLDDEIKSVRAFLSKCVAEHQRLCNQGRLTRRTRRNRTEILGHCETISSYSLKPVSSLSRKNGSNI